MTWYAKTALVLANVGAINWGLNELDWNVVDMLGSTVAPIVYWIVALCGIFGLYKTFSK